MTVLNRLKMELSNQQYFTDTEYIQFLTENNLTSTDEYVKSGMQKSLLLTVLDVLEAVANDVDMMKNITTEFGTEGAAYKYINDRIRQVKDKINEIPVEDEEYSCFSLMYTKTPRNQSQYSLYNNGIVTNRDIDEMLNN